MPFCKSRATQARDPPTNSVEDLPLKIKTDTAFPEVGDCRRKFVRSKFTYSILGASADTKQPRRFYHCKMLDGAAYQGAQYDALP